MTSHPRAHKASALALSHRIFLNSESVRLQSLFACPRPSEPLTGALPLTTLMKPTPKKQKISTLTATRGTSYANESGVYVEHFTLKVCQQTWVLS